MERLAVITGASTGIGYELARYATQKGYDLIIAADEPEIESAAERLRGSGAAVRAVQVDLSTTRRRRQALRGDQGDWPVGRCVARQRRSRPRLRLPRSRPGGLAQGYRH